jgi:hypothetical protein
MSKVTETFAGISLGSDSWLVPSALGFRIWSHPISQMLYLFLVETANVIVQVGIIYEPLIIQYGQPERVHPTIRICSRLFITGTAAAIAMTPKCECNVIVINSLN